MTENSVERKLRAILAADVVGYSQLMSEDEEGTLAALKAHRADFIDPIIEEHRGRIVKLMGDGVLIEFESVVDALKCAIAVQRGMPERNAEVPEDRQIVFRIGINLGDIIIDGDDIYGNGVNVAARLEALAEPGGICISGRVFDQVEKNVEVGFAFLGPQSVKNIDKPINAYKILLEPGAVGTLVDTPKTNTRGRLHMMAVGIALVVALACASYWYQHGRPEIKPASVDKMVLPLPDKPSIAVLPFENMSGDPEQQYFSDGITEQIITSISKVPYLFVIARQSSFAFRDKQMTVQQIAKELGVRYILEGSLQRSGERLRINAQLIDATSGNHLWAENYDHKLDDIFAVQDKICKNIMVALQVELTTGEMARIYADTVNDIRAYEKYLKGLEHHFRRTKEDSLIAQHLFQEAITLDPEYITPHIMLGWAYLDEIWLGHTKTPSDSIAKAEAMVQKAKAIQGMTAGVNELLCGIYLLKKDFGKAISHGEKAVEQTPGSAPPYLLLGMALMYNEQNEAAISSLENALQLNPVRPINYLFQLARAYFRSKKYEKAISTYNETLERNPDYLFAYMGLTSAYWLNGSEAEARQSAKHVLRINPKFSVGYWKDHLGKDKELVKQILDTWRKAGLPE